MGHLVPPRHPQRALAAALFLALAALLVLLPQRANGDLLNTITTTTSSLPTVSVPTVSVPTVSVPTVSVPTLPTTTSPTPTVSVPDLPTSTGSLPSTPLPTGSGSSTPLPTDTSGLPVIGGSGSGGSGGGTNTGGNTSSGSSGSGSGTTAGGGGGLAGTSGISARTGTGGGATDAAAAAPTLFGAAGGAGGSGLAGGGGLGGPGSGGGGLGGPGSGGGGSPLLGIPVLPGGGTPGVTPLAALLASHAVPDSGDRGFVGDAGHAITQVVDALPDWSKPIIGVLLALVLVLLFRSFLAGRRARKLERQRESLASDVADLQKALLAAVPSRLGSLGASVAYRPAEGLATGGDFYDAFALADGRAAIVVGDASGHGRDAISRAASVRYTLRAYLDAGLEPNAALRVAGRALESDSFDGDFSTAIVAVYDPRHGTLSYSCAGHPPPIVSGAAHRPITACAAPPIGWGVPTGLRLTTIPFPAGALACFFTDGLIEARVDGDLLGRDRLAHMIVELHPDDDAEALLDHLQRTADEADDDMAALILRATETPMPATAQVEELEIEPPDLTTGSAARFLEACGVADAGVDHVLRSAKTIVGEHGAAVLRVSMGDKLKVHVVPPSARSLEAVPASAPPAAATPAEPPKLRAE